VQKQYNRSCASCHVSGVANAPRTGDAAAWQAVLALRGMDALVQNVRNGYNAMPPMGMCLQCTDDDFRALIEYMAAPR